MEDNGTQIPDNGTLPTLGCGLAISHGMACPVAEKVFKLEGELKSESDAAAQEQEYIKRLETELAAFRAAANPIIERLKPILDEDPIKDEWTGGHKREDIIAAGVLGFGVLKDLQAACDRAYALAR